MRMVLGIRGEGRLTTSTSVTENSHSFSLNIKIFLTLFNPELSTIKRAPATTI